MATGDPICPAHGALQPCGECLRKSGQSFRGNAPPEVWPMEDDNRMVTSAIKARLIGLRDSATAMLVGHHDVFAWTRFARRVLASIALVETFGAHSEAEIATEIARRTSENAGGGVGVPDLPDPRGKIAP